MYWSVFDFYYWKEFILAFSVALWPCKDDYWLAYPNENGKYVIHNSFGKTSFDSLQDAVTGSSSQSHR